VENFQKPQCFVLFYTTVTLEELHRLLSLLLLPSHSHVSAMFLFRSSVSWGWGYLQRQDCEMFFD